MPAATARSISTERRESITPALPDDVHLIRSMEELVAALRARRDELQLTHETIDEVAGFASGYAGKLLAPKPIKNLGWMSLGTALDALAIGLLVVENKEQRALVEKRWIKREKPKPQVGANHSPPRLRSRK